MATSQPSLHDRRSPPPPPAFSSNNPFRRALASNNASLDPPGQPLSPPANGGGLRVDETMQRLNHRKSTNPFLDSYQAPAMSSPPRPRSRSPQKPAAAPRNNLNGSVDLLSGLTLSEKPAPASKSSVALGSSNVGRNRLTRGQGNIQQPRPAPSKDSMRPSHAAQDRRGPPGRGAPPPRYLDIFGNPNENRRPRARRNSESSVMEVQDEERKRSDKDRRRRERGEREGDGDKAKDSKRRDGRSQRPDRRVDLIDKLDLTGLYGPGGAFHHDGPFDACNPHRNRKGRKNTPMSAFPEGSANMMMGGSGPVNKILDYDRFHGRSEDAYNDWNGSSRTAEHAMTRKLPPHPVVNNNIERFDARTKVDPVHGQESAGLGTSTFMEGTPASRAALAQRREAEAENAAVPAHGLQRKKSLAQKIRGMSRPRPGGPSGDRPVYSPTDFENERALSPTTPTMTQSAGGRTKMNENNPFFSDYSSAGGAARPPTGNKETTIKIDEASVTRTGNRVRAGSESTQMASRSRESPTSGWRQHRSSGESSDGYGVGRPRKPSSEGIGGGFLNRVRSIKGKGRPVRPAAA